MRNLDKHTLEQRHKNMQAVKCKDSEIELLLRHVLWMKGCRYRKNVKYIFGHPDIAFLRKKIAVFCDSEFWHGHDWINQKIKIKSNRDFWIHKIENNIARDLEVNKYLIEHGWRVVRFWGKEIKKDTDACANLIVKILKEQI